MKRIGLLLATLLFAVVCVFGCGQSRADDQIIEDMIVCYGNYGAEADGKVADLLKELKKQNSKQGELWTDIMDYWHYVDTDFEVNTKKLPDGLSDGKNLCLIVLGYRLKDDGRMQDELIGRLKVALDCAKQYPNAYVLCTGGPTALSDKNVTEAGQMRKWLLNHGLKKDRLIMEDQSRTTLENAVFSYDILTNDHPEIDSAVIISSSYHVAWGSLMFEASFLKSASEKQKPEIHIVSNCAFPVSNLLYKEDAVRGSEIGGLLELIGHNNLARKYYYDYPNVEKPKL